MVNKRQHYVPKYYLRQFRWDGTERILVCNVDPYRCRGLGPLKGQCQRDHFYGQDGPTDPMLQESEGAIAPALYAVNQSRSASTEQWQALRLLAVQLHLRTSKAAELAKVLPRFATDQMIKGAIKNGELPEPEGGWSPEMMDFEGVPQSLLGLNLLRCYFETSTLHCKFLAAPATACFMTSDNPAVTLNQFAADAKGPRDYIGFAQSGFQLVLPLSPSLCVFLYDPFVYKVGNRNDAVVGLNPGDVEILNALQVQSAERCLYAHCLEAEREVGRLVGRFGRLRQPNTATLKSFPQSDTETLLKVGAPVMTLARPWQFCRYLRNVRRRVGDYRDPGFSHIVDLAVRDIEANPHNVELEERLDQVMRRLPEHQPIPVTRRPELHGIRLPGSSRDWNIGA